MNMKIGLNESTIQAIIEVLNIEEKVKAKLEEYAEYTRNYELVEVSTTYRGEEKTACVEVPVNDPKERRRIMDAERRHLRKIIRLQKASERFVP